MIKEAIVKIVSKEDLTYDEAYAVMNEIMSGETTQTQNAAFLAALSTKSARAETTDEIAGCAAAMRAHATKVDAGMELFEIVGTGGDNAQSFNISTTSALVAAAGGMKIAKHGNRAASSKAGAADTLEMLGLDMERAGASAEASLHDIGIAFLFAANHHPAMKRITPIRQRIGRRTIFNLMGPLANPAGVTRQLIRIARPDYAATYAAALEQLGTEAALVVSGEEGLDEISCAGPTLAVGVGQVALPGRIAPEDAGLPRHPLSAIVGGDPAYNAAALRRLLLGETGAYRDAVLFNAAAALIVAGTVQTLPDGVRRATEAIDSHAANALLDRWIAYS